MNNVQRVAKAITIFHGRQERYAAAGTLELESDLVFQRHLAAAFNGVTLPMPKDGADWKLKHADANDIGLMLTMALERCITAIVAVHDAAEREGLRALLQQHCWRCDL